LQEKARWLWTEATRKTAVPLGFSNVYMESHISKKYNFFLINCTRIGIVHHLPNKKIQFPSDSDLCFSETNHIELNGRAKKPISVG
jgi:hypothetical protein